MFHVRKGSRKSCGPPTPTLPYSGVCAFGRDGKTDNGNQGNEMSWISSRAPPPTTSPIQIKRFKILYGAGCLGNFLDKKNKLMNHMALKLLSTLLGSLSFGHLVVDEAVGEI